MNLSRGFAIVLLLMLCELHAFNNTTLDPPDSTDSVKASTKPTDYLNHITIIAHIANGITLQAGLMNGTIQIDEVVGEMLNLGSAKVSDLVNYKPDKILELIKKLKEVRQSVAANDKTTKMEKRALEWEDYRLRSELIGDVTNLTGSVEYFNAVENFKNEFNFTLLENIEKSFKEINEHIRIILENSLTDQIHQNSRWMALKLFPETFESLKKRLNKIKKFYRTSSFGILLNGPNIFKSLDTVIKHYHSTPPISRH